MAAYVTVHRTYDSIEAQLLTGVLRQEGIDARSLGGQASIFGAAQNLVQTRIDVPAEHAASATELITAIQAEATAGDEDGVPATGAARRPILAQEVRTPPRLSTMRAVGIAPLIPGGGHFVGKRLFVGGAVLVGQLVAIAAMVAGNPREATAGALIACGLLIFDVVGGALAVRAYNRGTRASSTRQLATALAALFGLGAAGTALAPQVMKLRPPQRLGNVPGTESEIRPEGLGPDQLPFPLRPDPWAGR